MATQIYTNFPSYYCKICDIDCRKKNKYEIHIMTSKHQKMLKNPNLATQNLHISPQIMCENCNMTFRNKRDYEKHLMTAKHQKKSTATQNLHKNPHSLKHNCPTCGKEYNTKSGLWRHRQQQKCIQNEEDKNNSDDDEEEYEYNESYSEISLSELDNDNDNHDYDYDNDNTVMPDIESQLKEKFESRKNGNEQQPLNNLITPELIIMLIQQNKEMQNMMMEQNKAMIELAKNAGHNTTNIQNNNKAFNMNFFLNETCKNAMNMSDFVDNLVVTTYDFEQTGILGYAEGIGRILENGLKKLEVHERPIHCSDAKRETIYIRENDRWEKDDENKTKLLGYIKKVGHKNIKMIPQWQKEHPGWSDVDSKENDRYLRYVFNSMCGGTTEETENNYGKIMRHVSRITMVDKSEQRMLMRNT
jgi:uncharacterized C2H2 Zn-finger protein